MLIELIAYRIGEPTLKPEDAFWIYTNLNKQQLAEVLFEMQKVNLQVNEENLLKALRYISAHKGHEWIKFAKVDDYTPVTLVDSKLN